MERLRRKYHLRAVFYQNPKEDSGPVGDAGVGYTKCFHKKPWSESPYLIRNEIIAAKLGTFIGLPIPPCAVMHSVDGTFWFSSIYFNFDEEELPKVLPDVIWKELPYWLSGVTLFDIFIANGDRHDENLVVDDVLKPKALRVFDHDQSLFGGATGQPRGIERLEHCKTLLGLDNDTGGMRNDFIGEITESKHFNKWLNRIGDIPEWFIKDAVDSTRPYGTTKEEAQACKEFLIDRRKQLGRIVMDNKHYFLSIHEMKIPGILL